MNILRVIVPFVILGVFGVVGFLIVRSKPEPQKKETERSLPVVRVLAATPENLSMIVKSQGTVQPETETQLSAEVSGRVLEVSPSFRPGGFFRAGEILIRIDPADYETAVAQREAALAEAQLNLLEESARGEQALLDWEKLGRGKPNPLTLREPQRARAEAAVRSAEAMLTQARRNLNRTEVRAPFDGRVWEKHVDVGQFVSGQPGVVLARIYSIAAAEVRLPLTDSELALLDLPFYFDEKNFVGPVVTLFHEFGGKRYQWKGNIIRSEAVIDMRSRLTYVVASFDDPYLQSQLNPERPPLKVGMFVRAEIKGKAVSDVFKLPRQVLVGTDEVLVVDSNNRLYRRTIDVIFKQDEAIWIRSGLSAGEEVVTSRLNVIVDGMSVKVEGSDLADESLFADDVTTSETAEVIP